MSTKMKNVDSLLSRLRKLNEASHRSIPKISKEDKIEKSESVPQSNDQENEVVTPDDIEKVQSGLRKLAEAKPEVSEMIAMQMQVGSLGNPLHHKMNEKHVSQVIDLAAKHDERAYEITNRQQTNDYEENKSHFVVIILAVFLSFSYLLS